ncbi:MAG: hypothetical protein A3E78_11660, partial [Alphaproteobacteria bacterium RIFCSPHIGHO2_12_FULL_63_12]
TSASDPWPSGGQILRRVSSTLKLAKDTYQAAEIASHRQIADFRHGTKRVTGGISGEFSPGTYWELIEAVLRANDAAAVSGSESDFTSATFDASASTVVFAGGDAHTVGFRIGDIIQFTDLAETANNSTNFLVTSMSGSNRTLGLSPAPTTAIADTAFSVTAVGRSAFMPDVSHVSRKFAFEHWFEDIDLARLFLECRMEGFNIQLPATGLATIDLTVMGRDMEIYQDSNSPFFSAPAAATSTGIFAAVNGVLLVGGSQVGVVTGLNVQAALGASSQAVVGQNYVPEVHLGRLNVTGQMTALLEDATFLNYFKDETEVAILAYLTTTSAIDAPAASIYLPRVKFGDADVPLSGESGQIITLPFQALKYASAAAGIEATTVRFTDTQATA